MAMKILQSTAALAVGIGILIVGGAPVYADSVSDAIASTEQNALDILNATITITIGGGNTSCAAHAYGTSEAPYTNVVVGSVNGEDTSIGDAECASLSGEPFQQCLTVQKQYWVPGTGPWTTFAQSGSTCTNAVGAGVTAAAQSAVIQNTYPQLDPHLNTWHRTHTLVTTSTGARQNAYSAAWFQAAI